MTTLTRNELYEDVWSRPCTKIAADLGISSSALKRICVEMNIPTPPTGHWTQVHCGKKVVRSRLPEAMDGIRLTWTIDLESSKKQKEDHAAKVALRTERKISPVEVPATLDHPHPLVASTQAHHRELKKNIPWDQRKERKRFNLQVSDDAMERALKFLDGFARGVENLGLSFKCELDTKDEERSHSHHRSHDQERRSPFCWIEGSGERVSFRLREPNRRVRIDDPEERKKLWRDWKDVPSGLFEFSIDSGWGFKGTSTWKDGKMRRIENCLGEIIATVPAIGEHLRLERLRHEAEHKHWEDLATLSRNLENQRRREGEALADLIKQANDFNQAQVLRGYIDAVRSRAFSVNCGLPSVGSPTDLWLRWAEARATMMDPLCGEGIPWSNALLAVLQGQERS